MIYNAVLLSLLEHLSITNKPMIIGWRGVQSWPDGALEKLLELGIMVSAAKAQSLVCGGCEQECFMNVLTQASKHKKTTRAFIVCDDAEIQSQIGRIEIPLEQLQQWQCSAKQIAKVIADLLNIKDKIEQKSGQNNIRIGMLQGSKGRRWLSLNTQPLSLEVNGYTVPIEEILFFEGTQLTIDQWRINELVNSNPRNIGKKYTPSTDKREASKRKTQAMYQDWNDAYLKLRKKKPGNSDVWYSQQIARMPVGQGKSYRYILRKMKY